MTTKTKIPFAIGDRIEVTRPEDPHFGRIFDVLEISEEDVSIRTEKGWFDLDAIEAAKKEIAAEIDGKSAKVVLNGKTGVVQDTLIDIPIEQLCYDMACVSADLKIAKSNAGRAREYCKELKEKKEKISEELESRGIKAIGRPPQLALAESLEEAEDDEEDD